MYCDPILWKNVRDCVLDDGISRRGAARKFGLARNTVRKMLLDELPPPREKRTHRRPMIGPHEATITRMVKERSRSGYGYSPRIRRIFEFISNEENYRGSYSAVRDYVSLLQDGPVPAKISEDTWMYSSDVLFSIGHQKSALFLKAMSHGRQPVLSEAKVKSFAQKAMGYRKKNQPNLDKPLSYGRAKDWLHSIAAGTMTAHAIALSVGETEDLEELLQIAGCGNRIKRNRALTILGSQAGFSIRSIAAALKIARGSCAKYVALYREFGPEGLLQRKPSANRKYDNSALKDAVFALFHEPPSNYDINRTT
jgi:transposase